MAKDSPHVWLIDRVAKQFPQLRVWVYGFSPSIEDQSAVEDKYEFADSFVKLLYRMRKDSGAAERALPIVYIAHSLGGLLFKEAMIRLYESNDEFDRNSLMCTYGALLFGVPSNGMNVNALATMAGQLEARTTLNDLDERIGYRLRTKQHSEFCRAFNFRDAILARFFELHPTPTVQKDSTTKLWSRSGPPEMLVSQASATLGRPWDTEDKYIIGLQGNHSTMVKLSEHSQEYHKIYNILEQFSKNATTAITRRHQPMEAMPRSTQSNFEEMRHTSVSDGDRNECLKYLSSSLDYAKMKDRNRDREPETCLWTLDSTEYHKWKADAKSCLLFITAEPGCGKSTLAKFLVDDDLASNSDRHTCYFFFKEDDALQRSLNEALCAMLLQILSEEPSLISSVMLKTKVYGSNVRTQTSVLWELLLQLSQESKHQTVCILDALDEADQGDRLQFIQYLSSFFMEKRTEESSIKFLITGRPYYGTTYNFRNLVELPYSSHLRGEDAPIGEEIETVIQNRVRSLSLDEDSRIYLRDRLLNLQTETRTYLWITLIFDRLRHDPELQYVGRRKIDRFLENLPLTIYEIYESILKKSSDPPRAKTILQLIIAAKRPLSTTELSIALELAGDDVDEITKHAALELQPEQAFMTTLRQLCGHFVTVIDGQVYLIHQTARQFLLSKSLQGSTKTLSNGGNWHHSLSPTVANALLARSCIFYLLLEDFDRFLPFHMEDNFERFLPFHMGDNSDNMDTDSDYLDDVDMDSDDFLEFAVEECLFKFPFLEYCSKHFLDHVRLGGEPFNRTLLPWKAVTLCDITSCRFWLWFFCYADFTDRGYCDPLSYVKVLCDSILKSRFSWAPMVGQEVPRSCPPMFWSMQSQAFSFEPYFEVAGYKDNPSTAYCDPGWNVQVAVEMAGRLGDAEFLKRLPTKAPGSNCAWKYCPADILAVAASRGHLWIVKLLYECEVEMCTHEGARIAIFEATRKGYADIVQYLLQQGADVNVRTDGERSQTPLMVAAEYGYVEIVRILLDWHADPLLSALHPEYLLMEAPEYMRWTALDYAVGAGEKRVAEILRPVTVRNFEHKITVMYDSPDLLEAFTLCCFTEDDFRKDFKFAFMCALAGKLNVNPADENTLLNEQLDERCDDLIRWLREHEAQHKKATTTRHFGIDHLGKCSLYWAQMG